MSFTGRIISGNLLIVLVAVIGLTLFNKDGNWLTAALIGLLLMAGSTVILWILCKQAFKPLDNIVAAMEKAAAGDLSIRVNGAGSGEIARLGSSFNAMMNDINKAMRKFFSVADLVRDSVNLVQNTTNAMAAAAEEVAMQAGTIAIASEEMAATSADIARNCLTAAENSRQATTRTKAGANTVRSGASIMENIASRVIQSSHTVEGLGQRSDQIGAIVGTIEDIADQTNLLALNAAIEAARAGEMGRGFAVVADEVRALAERTTRATQEIAGMIKTIQHETKSAVDSMYEGVEEVKRGTAGTTSSGAALDEILFMIDEVSDQINQVATAAEEQTATTNEITSNIHQITEIVSNNVASARGTTEATVKLAQQVDDLHQLVGNFRLASALVWDDSFNTNIRTFDDQHKVLFNMINELHDAMQQKRSKEAISNILKGLADYTVNHFAEEERAFDKTGYTETEKHKQMHKTLVDQVVDLIGKYQSGETVLSQDIIDFLQKWLMEHIKGQDKKYAPHLIKHGIR